MQEKYAEKLEKQYEKEEKTKASFKAFKRYFTKFLDSTPSILRKKMLLPKINFQRNRFGRRTSLAFGCAEQKD